MTECMEVEDLNDFNDIFYRPPNFCSYCGELLDFEIIKEDQTQCQRCGGMTELNKVISHQIETTEYYDYSKEWMNKLKNKEDKLKAQQKVKRSTINEKCQKCGHNRMYFYTVQLRSADEGSTVFYECVKCKSKYTTNN